MLCTIIFVLKENTKQTAKILIFFFATLCSVVNSQAYHWPTTQQQKDKILIKSVRFAKISSPYEQMLGYCEHRQMLG